MIRSLIASPGMILRRSAAVSIAVRPAPTSTAVLINSNLAARGYRGDTGDALKTLSSSEEALIKVAKPKADAIFAKHIELPENGSDVAARRKRLIYRSKQRGWLEVDLLLGTWYVIISVRSRNFGRLINNVSPFSFTTISFQGP